MTLFLGFTVFMLIGCAVSLAGGLIGMPAYTAVILTAVLFAASIVICVFVRRKIKRMNYETSEEKGRDRFISFDSAGDIFFFAVFILLLLFQIVTVIMYQAKDPAVLRQIKESTAVFETGRLGNGEPIMNLYGTVSYVLKIHPLSLIFTWLPPVLILFYYLGIYEFLKLICDDRREVFPAMCFTSILFIWGYYCRKLICISLLLSSFSGGCFILYGLCISIGIVLLKKKDRIKESKQQPECYEEDEEYLEEWDMKKHKIINIRNLCVVMAVFMVAVCAVIFIVNRKINDLHDATVNLEADLNSRCSIYEYAPDGADVCGYLIKGSDGAITVIGGGDESNSDSLSEFITKYGTNVSNWYVYSDDAKDTGALGKILQGSVINVEKVYILDRKEVSNFLQ